MAGGVNPNAGMVSVGVKKLWWEGCEMNPLDPNEREFAGRVPPNPVPPCERTDLDAGRAQITISLRLDGAVLMRSTFMSRADASYMPLSDDRVPVEVAKLLAELRQQMAAANSVSTRR